MDVATLLKSLEGERDALDATIKTLRARIGGSQTHAKPQGAPKPHGSVWTPAKRLAMSKKLKAVLAAKKKGKGKPAKAE